MFLALCTNGSRTLYVFKKRDKEKGKVDGKKEKWEGQKPAKGEKKTRKARMYRRNRETEVQKKDERC